MRGGMNLPPKEPVSGEQPLPASAAPPASLNWRDLRVAVPILWGFDVASVVMMGALMFLLQGPKALGDPNPAWPAAQALASNLFALGVMWRFACRKYRKSFVEAFALRHPGAGTLGYSVLIGVAAAGLGTLLSLRFGTNDSFLAKMVSTNTGLILFVILAVTMPPFEELYYRGFVFPALRQALGARWSVAVVGIWFCLVHVPQLAGDWMGVPVVLAMSFIWTLQRQICQSLVPSLVCHWIYNACVVGFSFWVSA